MKKKNQKNGKNPNRHLFFFLAFNIVFTLTIFAVFSKVPPLIPMYYGAPIGELQLATKAAIFIPTIFALIITLISLILSTIISDTFLKRTFIFASGVITFLCFYTTLRIIFLVGNI